MSVGFQHEFCLVIAMWLQSTNGRTCVLCTVYCAVEKEKKNKKT